MTDVVLRKMLVDALKSHPHAALIADVIIDGMKIDDYSKLSVLVDSTKGRLLVDAFAGIDHRLLIPEGTTVIVKLNSYYSGSWDIPAMQEEGSCVDKDWYVAVVTEVSSYITTYPYKVNVSFIDKEGNRKEESHTVGLKETKRWVK